ncbi:hypothetical protein BLNAU_23377 [Blattamonas nauphoetae]|uniref:Uncharacterized protein n=1 Tax=Blattamonas nauphoetae TaxID=2049346 RepID=A0ABQ9WQH4_9EUKA|nr:hypothetical protein BLNAU_23377 [Blattamonas nauphoetae]
MNHSEQQRFTIVEGNFVFKIPTNDVNSVLIDGIPRLRGFPSDRAHPFRTHVRGNVWPTHDKFTDILRVNSVPTLGRSQIVIYFVNGFIYHSGTPFKTDDAMRFGQAVNGYLMQHAPQNLASVQTLHPQQPGYGMHTGYPPLTEYGVPSVYGQPPIGFVGSSQPPATVYSTPYQPPPTTAPVQTISKE